MVYFLLMLAPGGIVLYDGQVEEEALHIVHSANATLEPIEIEGNRCVVREVLLSAEPGIMKLTAWVEALK